MHQIVLCAATLVWALLFLNYIVSSKAEIKEEDTLLELVFVVSLIVPKWYFQK